MRHLTKPVRVVHHRCLILLAFLMMLSSPVAAQDYDKGLAAAKAGDLATALEEWRPLAEAGDSLAQYSLGLMYKSGQGVPQDDKKAFKWYKLAAEQGFIDAQNNLGFMYSNGQGVPQDYAEAVKWYRLAADQGDAGAQSNLGVMYYHGWGVPQDYKEAVKWYRLAADQGYAKAQNNLGNMYYNGQGGPQDNTMAHMWFNIGAANGNELGVTNRDIIAKKMTPQAIETAQAMARKCMETNYKDCGY